MTNSTLEKVARAMCADLGMNPDDWDEPLDGPRVYRWQVVLPTARAALQSLRQVDDETTKAMCDVWYDCPEGDGPEEITRAILAGAISAILTEGGEG